MIPTLDFTCTPNIFFDEIIKTLNEGELRVILIVLRQTFGWRKNSDWMTYTFLAKKTGYNRESVIKILNRLIAKNLVTKRVVGNAGSQRCYYSLVMQKTKQEEAVDVDAFDTEEDIRLMNQALDDSFKDIPTSVSPNTTPRNKSNKIIPTSVRRNTPPVFDGTPPQCSTEHPTKETHTKETDTKLSVTAGGAAVLEEKSKEKGSLYKKQKPIPQEQRSLPAEAIITTTGNKRIRVSQSEVYARVIGAGINCSSEAIRYAWAALCECKAVIHDWFKFIEGTINKYNNKAKSDNIYKSKRKNIKDEEIENEVNKINQMHGLNGEQVQQVAAQEEPTQQQPSLRELIYQKQDTHQEKIAKDKADVQESHSLPLELIISTSDNRKVGVTKEEAHKRIMEAGIKCSEEAMHYAWGEMCKRSNCLNDWFKFIEPIVRNYKDKVNEFNSKQNDITNKKT